ncbi:pantoate--beta-alanine ligase [Cesiribacter sp. SM1]|uniref:pantoate--beta-alanine ligase n=1 Tax=Cesiribacter sp. SM1 TaxID=2861196 RepID=UPI001CD2B0E1|nr:pantoate--beta-alanine ligase [Cesiribacter sp. SM1]
MLVFRKKEALRQHLQEHRLQNTTIGFVPTMGALHQGHLSLIRKSLELTGYTVCSIFVNPAQFNNPEDLKKYPRMPEQDIALLEAAGCHAVFLPEADEIYPTPPLVQFSFGPLEKVMEGYYRPGHFSGVALIVSKLLHIVQPHMAFFGQKDLQQCRILEQLVKDLGFNTEIQIEPTVREADGLALSSRNLRLSREGRQTALHLYVALQQAAEAVQAGIVPDVAQKNALAYLQNIPNLEPEYFYITEGGTLQELRNVQKGDQIAICTAAYVEGVRLIDNLLISYQGN